MIIYCLFATLKVSMLDSHTSQWLQFPYFMEGHQIEAVLNLVTMKSLSFIQYIYFSQLGHGLFLDASQEIYCLQNI